jgi:hypothetical protein
MFGHQENINMAAVTNDAATETAEHALKSPRWRSQPVFIDRCLQPGEFAKRAFKSAGAPERGTFCK